MIEQLRFHTIDELQALSLAELQALWELVPTERQRSYRTAYDREVRNAGAIGSDALERQVAAELLKRYDESALVPVGLRWARTPLRVQEAARENDLPDMADTKQLTASAKPSPKILLLIGLLALVFVAVLVPRLFGASSIESEPELTAEVSPTPMVSPTPTPLALEAQDDVITGGDQERVVAYPVNLQVVLPDDASAPRVWVVQRRTVRAAEWNYDLNPDIASFVGGMSVRPVIGIPHSEDNAAWFEAMQEGAVFNLTMNTGAILRYEFAAKTDVRRSDTSIFRQVGPGLVLLLIGETDADGLPTATRTLVTATYPPDQELSRGGEWIPVPGILPDATALPTPTPTPAPFANVAVQLVSVTTVDGQITTHLRIYNPLPDSVTFTQDDIWLALGYAPDPPGPRNPAEGMQPFALFPEQAVNLTLVWYWANEPYAALQVGRYRWALQFSP